MIVWGGYDDARGYLNTGGKYNPDNRYLDADQPSPTRRLDDDFTRQSGPALK